MDEPMGQAMISAIPAGYLADDELGAALTAWFTAFDVVMIQRAVISVRLAELTNLKRAEGNQDVQCLAISMIAREFEGYHERVTEVAETWRVLAHLGGLDHEEMSSTMAEEWRVLKATWRQRAIDAGLFEADDDDEE